MQTRPKLKAYVFRTKLTKH